MRFLDEMDITGKKVLVRVDFNVPLDDDGNITDDSRIKAALPTIQFLLEKNSKIVLMSHLGRPKGKAVDELKMDIVATHLSVLLGQKVTKMDDCINIDMPEDEIVLLENLRFHEEEKKNDESFAEKLASLADVYVNDAFGTCHRTHASVDAITHHLPSCAGRLLQKEVETLSKAMEKPERPFIAILGGAKVSDKIGVIENLLPKVDAILIGGAMMFTFLKANGHEIGRSLVEDDKLQLAEELIKNAGNKVILPVDTVVADSKTAAADPKTVPVNDIPSDMFGLDIGEETVAVFSEMLKDAKTVLWNGPMGMFEVEQFAAGTREIAKAVAELKGTTIIGGGDSVAAVKQLGLTEKMTHVSTGGGASLELLEGKTLPALAALEENQKKFS